MIKLSIANPAEYIDKIRPLIDAHWEEMKFDYNFDPDVEMYEKMYQSGFCFAVIAELNSEIVGYCTVLIAPHQHNKGEITASNDAIFISKQHRHGILSGRLIKFAEDTAKEMGAARFFWHCRPNTNLANMLINHDYLPCDMIVSRKL